MKKFLFPLVFFIFLTSFFFYKTILYGYIPLPADSLAGGFEPYRSYSFLGYAAGAVPHKAQGPDVIRQLFVWKYFSIEQIQKGQFPLWNPYNFAGNPHIANFQTGIFYPFNIVFFIAPFTFAWSFFLILQPFLALNFTYLFLRDKVSSWAAAYGAIVFSFCLFMAVWFEYGNVGHAFLWLPLSLFALERLFKRLMLRWFLILLLSLVLSLLAGHIQSTFYVYLISFSFFVFHCFRDGSVRKRDGKFFLSVAGCFIIPLLLVMFQLLPTIEIFLHSARNAYTFNQLADRLMDPKNMVTAFLPDFFGNPATRTYWGSATYIEQVSYFGILPLFFVFFGLFTKRTKIMIFFAGVMIISYISALNIFPIRFMHGLGIPLISTFVPTRALGMYVFAGAVLSSYGFSLWENMQEQKKIDRKIIMIAIFFVSISSVALFLLSFAATDQQFFIAKKGFLPMIFLAFGIVAVLARRFFSISKIKFVIFFLTIVDLFYFFQKITPFSPSEFVYPQTPVMKKLREIQGIDRFWGYGSGYVETNLQTYEKLFSTDGYDPLFIKRYGEFIAASKNGNVSGIIPRSDVVLEQGYGGKDLEENAFRKRVLDLSGVKYILNKKDHAFPRDRYRFVWADQAFEIYENTDSVPRIFLANNYIIEKTKEAIIKRLFDKQFNPKTTIVLEEKPNIEIGGSFVAQTARLRLYSPNKVIIDTESDANTLLFLSDNYYRGWKVSIDGKDGTIYRANYTFRAVPVEKGKHEVIFFYKPESFRFGLYISFITFLFVMLFSIFSKRYGIFKNA